MGYDVSIYTSLSPEEARAAAAAAMEEGWERDEDLPDCIDGYKVANDGFEGLSQKAWDALPDGIRLQLLQARSFLMVSDPVTDGTSAAEVAALVSALSVPGAVLLHDTGYLDPAPIVFALKLRLTTFVGKRRQPWTDFWALAKPGKRGSTDTRKDLPHPQKLSAEERWQRFGIEIAPAHNAQDEIDRERARTLRRQFLSIREDVEVAAKLRPLLGELAEPVQLELKRLLVQDEDAYLANRPARWSHFVEELQLLLSKLR